MISDGIRFNSIYVPCHVKEELKVVGSHLRIVDIDNPELAAVMIICFLHLTIDQSGLSGSEPEIVVRTSPI